MARRLIGLDVGTNAVAVAEVSPGSTPKLNLFGQVALPRDAMREGEVVDEAAVSEAVARLRTEVGLRKTPVRVGIASPRVIVRQVEMPVMSRDDLASALRFQAPDLIPIPIDEAAIDFAILGTDTPEEGEPSMRVLLAAVQQATVQKLVAAVEAGGLAVNAVDLVPLALIRALGHPHAPDAPGAEAIVSFGGGVTAITVHENGVPRFVRVLGTGGRELTDAISSELELPGETAESLKRQLAVPGDNLLTRARAAIDRPMGALLDDVRSSVDYYRNQPGASPLSRVVITGGSSQLPGLAERLSASIGVPVQMAHPRELLQVGDVGFSESDLPRLDPYLPAAVGLALGGAADGTVVNLLPKAGRSRKAAGEPVGRQRLVVGGAVAAALVVVALSVPTLSREHAISNAKKAVAAQNVQNASLQRQIGQLSSASQEQDTVTRTTAEVQSLLANDVSWSNVLTQLSQAIPPNVWLSGFTGSVAGPSTIGGAAATASPSAPASSGASATAGAGATTPAPTGKAAAAAAVTPIGTVTFTGNSLNYAALSAWLDRVGQLKSFSQLFVPNATLQQTAAQPTVTFTSNANLTSAAHSTDRLQHYLGTGQ
jgi:type IV pilus assembly protein PilM